jgi:hypothetical protein
MKWQSPNYISEVIIMPATVIEIESELLLDLSSEEQELISGGIIVAFPPLLPPPPPPPPPLVILP